MIGIAKHQVLVQFCSFPLVALYLKNLYLANALKLKGVEVEGSFMCCQQSYWLVLVVLAPHLGQSSKPTGAESLQLELVAGK